MKYVVVFLITLGILAFVHYTSGAPTTTRPAYVTGGAF